MSKKKIIDVVELFAGVGGFRIGLEGWNGKSASSGFKKPLKSRFRVIWSNQWEPSTKTQHASKVYEKVFQGGEHSNKDISTVKTSEIPDHQLLVGGFPCQDYSVARTLNQSAGLEGKKGVLWWEIHRILKEKKNRPPYLLLENVDRLLKSPVKQRGRDFAIMLASLSDLGYIVEWRVINAADYGMPQRRKRVFFLAYLNGTSAANAIVKYKDPYKWVLQKGTFANSFDVQEVDEMRNNFSLEGTLVQLSKGFNSKGSSSSPFSNSGIMINRIVYTTSTKPFFNGKRFKLKNVIIDEGKVPEEYFIKQEDIPKWEELKGAKSVTRVNKNTGYTYQYAEGRMSFPDAIDMPSRTIVTGEGGSTPSRFKHVIMTKSGKLRRLTPLELERLNMFPDNHTAHETDVKRAFFMGNALVTGVIEKISQSLLNYI